MKVFVVYAHPEPTSFNGALKDRTVQTLTEAGHEVVVTDLHAENFDPRAGRHDFETVADPTRFDYQIEQKHAAATGTYVPELARDQDRLFWCDLLIFHFPIWWFGPPGILKGWIDRVLGYGHLYDLGHRYATGKLQGRRAIVCTTTGGPAERFGPEGQYDDIGVYLRLIEFGVFEYLGFEALERFVAWSAGRVSDDARKAYLDAWGARLNGLDISADALRSVG
ncbi:MAG: NAD(P)H-dependent oxidoreductase [Pseudomonadota bacterium]